MMFKKEKKTQYVLIFSLVNVEILNTKGMPGKDCDVKIVKTISLSQIVIIQCKTYK